MDNAFLSNLSQILLLINIVLFLRGFSKFEKPLKFFTVYLIVMFIIEMIVSYFNYLGLNNLFLSHFYFVFQFIILSFFYNSLYKNKWQKKILRVCFIGSMLILCIQYFYDPSLFYKFNLLEIFITSFLIIIYASFHFYNLLSEEKHLYFINTGILIYIFSSTIVFFMGNLLAFFKIKGSENIYMLNSLMYVVFQLLILYEWKISIYKSKI